MGGGIVSERPTDEQVERAAVTGSVSHADARILAREVQASRKLIADLRAALDLRGTLCVRYNEAQCDCCASVHKARRLIEEHES